MHFVSIYVVHLYSSIATAWKKSCFIWSDRSDFLMIDNLSIAVHTFTRHMLSLLSVNEILLPRYVNLSTNFRGLSLRVEIVCSHWKHMYSVWFAFMQKPILPVACTRLFSRDLGLGRCICKKCLIICIVCICYSFCRVLSASCLFLVWSHFLLLDQLTFKVYSLGKLLTNVLLMYLLAKLQQQCWKSQSWSGEQTIVFMFL